MRLSAISSAIAVLALSEASFAATLTSDTQLKKSYDFVIVGGGTAGSVLANRLTEDPHVNVLVIEAGGSDVGNLGIQVPFLGVSLPGTPVDWNYTTTPQPGLSGRSIPYTRGKVLGGSSCLNLLTWNICANDLWNHWASITGDSGWAWANVQKYYLKTSRLVPSADGHDTTGQVNPAVHGNGPVEVSVPGFPLPLDNLVVNSSKQLGGIWKYNEDINAGNGLGTTFMQSSIGGGERSDAASAYLHPVESRSNLDVMINTQVTRVLNANNHSRQPAFRTVEYAQTANGARRTVTAAKEVILAAGVIGSPQILQLSGIGPGKLLSSLGIKTIINNSAIGQGLSDHPLVPLYYQVNSTATWDAVLRNNDVFNADLAQWMSSHTGLFVNSPGSTQSFLRIPSDDPIFKTTSDPAAGPESAHLEAIFINAFASFGTVAPPTSGNFLTVLAAVVSPTSRGSVTISSADAFDHPLINPALYTSAFDTYAIVKVIRDVQQFLQAAPFKGYVLSPFGDLASAVTDAELLAYTMETSITVNHPSGTCAMSDSRSSGGVVDSSLLLKGAAGLRVVDASVFPSVPSCHIQAIVYTLAERAADLIKTQYRLS